MAITHMVGCMYPVAYSGSFVLCDENRIAYKYKPATLFNARTSTVVYAQLVFTSHHLWSIGYGYNRNSNGYIYELDVLSYSHTERTKLRTVVSVHCSVVAFGD